MGLGNGSIIETAVNFSTTSVIEAFHKLPHYDFRLVGKKTRPVPLTDMTPGQVSARRFRVPARLPALSGKRNNWKEKKRKKERERENKRKETAP